MSISAHIGDGVEIDTVPVAGYNEIRSLWMPIIQQYKLVLIEVAVSGGLRLTSSIHSEFMRELDVLIREIDTNGIPACGLTSPLARCVNLRTLIINNFDRIRENVFIG